MAEKGIKNSWSLVGFAQAKGPRMQVGKFANKETGDIFDSCIFTDSKENRTFVAFSSNLGTLTPQEIASLKDKLQVVQLESGTYKLCKAGENQWADVNLGL
jgi:hypothetical protein